MALASSLFHRLRKLFFGTLMVLAGLALLGASYQQIGQALDRHAVHAPGRHVTVNNVSMHLYCTGEGGPTVILEAGAFGFAQAWAWIQPKVAEHTRVCSYDRAGLGWSEDATPHDGVAAARRLHTLLRNAGEHGPYVLVGHSLGGPLIRIFATHYPDDVVALGFIEPSHPDQLERFPPEAREAHERVVRVLSVAAELTYVGLLRLANPLGRLHAGLPADDYRAGCMFTSAATHVRASQKEFAAWDTTMAAARSNISLGERPVVVVSGTEPMEGMTADILALNHQLHAEMAGLSKHGRHVTIEGASHMSLLTRREHAEQVAQLLNELVDSVAR
ncbi:Pimeloyl-ACP methyl ester carboxylesterase [Nannocystis exedens]|uniref:Pimeloyl-ACP methyl ester carboxylesterase n=2 Tax=Nannocystis exedens TaxID=54 RepID=A0A1I2HR91_9BACT|nr:alpha/beta hydrolase [Nannocystis exedens]PCC69438.1 haloalkane dehalogenase [Nannocystis exedens]SFF31820.1 Pimeloyl-ACP methyl ester carboxylesterase [Nannocystis exedens]